MKKRFAIAFVLLILLTTITSQQKTFITKFNLKEIKVDNNFLVDKKDIKKLLAPLYGKNLIFLKNSEIEEALKQNSFIESFSVKKNYPSTLKIKLSEKKPIAILINRKEKFYLSEKISLIKFTDLKKFQDLPVVFGNEKEFKIFYENLKKINFPISHVKKYTLYENNRWDLETTEKKIVKLPTKNYKKSLLNFLDLVKKKDFKKYKVFDYRINNQLILK